MKDKGKFLFCKKKSFEILNWVHEIEIIERGVGYTRFVVLQVTQVKWLFDFLKKVVERRVNCFGSGVSASMDRKYSLQLCQNRNGVFVKLSWDGGYGRKWYLAFPDEDLLLGKFIQFMGAWLADVVYGSMACRCEQERDEKYQESQSVEVY